MFPRFFPPREINDIPVSARAKATSEGHSHESDQWLASLRRGRNNRLTIPLVLRAIAADCRASIHSLQHACTRAYTRVHVPIHMHIHTPAHKVVTLFLSLNPTVMRRGTTSAQNRADSRRGRVHEERVQWRARSRRRNAMPSAEFRRQVFNF